MRIPDQWSFFGCVHLVVVHHPYLKFVLKGLPYFVCNAIIIATVNPIILNISSLISNNKYIFKIYSDTTIDIDTTIVRIGI